MGFEKIKNSNKFEIFNNKFYNNWQAGRFL
jgi:hypothetical protein